MNYLLDTSVCVEHSRSRSSIEQHLAKLPEDAEVFLCSIVLAELWHGFEKSQKRNNSEAVLQKFIEKFDSLPFDDSCARIYGKIMRELERQGNTIGGNDLLIAAIALANNLQVVTNNLSHFDRVPGLVCEAWN